MFFEKKQWTLKLTSFCLTIASLKVQTFVVLQIPCKLTYDDYFLVCIDIECVCNNIQMYIDLGLMHIKDKI